MFVHFTGSSLLQLILVALNYEYLFCFTTYELVIRVFYVLVLLQAARSRECYYTFILMVV